MYTILSNNKKIILYGRSFDWDPNEKIDAFEIKQISYGYSHGIIHTYNGEVFVFGDRCFHGQTGLGYNILSNIGLGIFNCISNFKCKPTLLMKDTKIRSIHCGHDHSVIYKQNGDVFVFGWNEYGQLGLEGYSCSSTPKKIMNDKDIELISCGLFNTIYYKHSSPVDKNNGKIKELFFFGWNIPLGYGEDKDKNK